MRRRLVLGLILLAAVSAQQPSLRGQLSKNKKKLFLKAREDIEPVPKATVTPRPKTQGRANTHPLRPEQHQQPRRASPTATPRATPKPAPEPKEIPRPTPRSRAARKTATEARGLSSESPTPDVIPLESPETPAPTPPQIPRGKTPLGERLEAPISLRSQDWKRTRDSSRLRDEEVGSSDGDA